MTVVPRLFRQFAQEGVVLLESAVDRVVADVDRNMSPEWETYLLEWANAHPLFRRRRIALFGGKGRVVLTGRVSSFYEKQLAQESLRHCEGVQQIDNRIEVAYDE